MKLTPNQRLAIFLQGSALDTEVFPIKVWLERLYHNLNALEPQQYPNCLTVHEEEILWEEAIKTTAIGRTFSQVGGLARMAREAWHLSLEWKLPTPNDLELNEDCRAYLEWQQNYRIIIAERGLLDFSSAVDKLIKAIDSNKISLPEKITLIGFEELTPQYERLFEAIQQAGTAVQFESLVSKPGKLARIAAKDLSDELELACCKVKQWLAEAPEASIGIVVPELARDRSLVVRLLQKHLPLRSYNVAAPLALNRYPIIESALSILSVFLGERSLEDWSQLLRSPFLMGSQTEQLARVAIDVGIRHYGEVQFSFESFIKKIEHFLSKKQQLFVPELMQSLKSLQLECLKLKSKHSAIAWLDFFRACIAIMGWPGERDITLEETQVQQQWEELLEQYQAMDRILGLHSYTVALQEISRLASNIVYLPAPFDGRVKVLGMLESIGLPFDYLWVVGLSREAWPQDPAPNPFIARSLQREYGLPRSCAVRELKMAQQFTHRLCQGGREVIFSYPLNLEMGQGFVSPLLESIPEVTTQDLKLKLLSNTDQNFLLNTALKSESFTTNFNEMAPQVLDAEKIMGGSRVLKLQALCPFRAFAEIRLQAFPMPVHALGLNPAERGEVVHEVLGKIWEELKNQDILNSMLAEDLNKLINGAIDSVLYHWGQKSPKVLTPAYLELEKQRTFVLVSKLLELDKSRDYFEVLSTEQKQVVSLNNLKISMRIDRIDRLYNQQEVILDYKTGKTSLSEWFGPRIRDPQLPLYAITRDLKPAAIAFLMVRPDGVKFQGLAKEKTLLPGVKTVEQLQWVGAAASFEEQCAEWKKSLERLAGDFMAGVAIVDPVDGSNTCRTCSLKLLCRVEFSKDKEAAMEIFT